MKLKAILWIMPVAVLAIACGKDETQVGTNKSGSTTGAVITVPGGTVPVATTNVRSGCGPNAPENPYEAYVTGTGAYKNAGEYVEAVFNRPIIADQTLRVSINPQGAGANSTAGGSQSYGKMALRVTLVRDGIAVASKDIGGLPDASGYKVGYPAGQLTDPMVADFDKSFLRPNAQYKILVSAVKTDWNCKIGCSPGNASLACQPYYGSCNTYAGYYQNVDYNSGATYCCYNNNLYNCQQLNCGVGLANSTASWTTYLYVETDNTKCIAR